MVSCALPVRSQSAAPVEVPVRILPLEIKINGVDGGLWPVVERSGAYFAPLEALESWRLQRGSSAVTMDYRGLSYVSLSSLPGVTVNLDATLNELNLTVAADMFAATRLKRSSDATVKPDASVPALFLNYDVSADFARPTSSPATSSLGVNGELGLSSDWGLLSNSFVARNLAGTQSAQREYIRLNSSVRKDFPNQRVSLTLGDGATKTGYLGRSSYFGGIQIGSNFGLTPGFNRNPIPVISGETRTPSTVQLYVNNVLRQTARVPSGPFTLDNLPVVSGNGEVSVVVRDVLGRETVITQPFFVTSDLLAPGINDWSAEFGKLRLNLGAVSNDYGATFGSGMWRRGITNGFTLEGRAERTAELSTLGASAVVALGGKYLGRVGVTTSDDLVLGRGQRWLAGMDWQNRDRSWTVAVEKNSRHFIGLGDARDGIPMRLQFSGQAGFSLGALGSLGAGFVLQHPYDGDRVQVLSLNHNVELRNRWRLGTSLSRVYGPTASGFTASVTLSIPLDKRTSSAFAAQYRAQQTEFNASAARSPEGIYGTAWRLTASQTDRLRAEGAAYHFGASGIYSGEVSTSGGQTNMRLGANGALLLAGGKLAGLQRFDTSAALVEVPGYPDIGVGLGGRITTRTDASGRALVTGLNAYQGNPVQLSADDLPITAEIDNIEQTTVPASRSVTRVTFNVRGGRGALIRVVLDDGQPAPVGSVIRLQGEDREFLLSRRGEAYVTGLKESNALVFTWKGKSCPLMVTLPSGGVDDIARVGPISCQGVER